MSASHSYGVTLPNGCTIVHGQGANIKYPFSDIPVEMHELDPGSRGAFSGQFGFIEFSTDFRLPRHVHIAPPSSSTSTPSPGQASPVAAQKFIAERIVVLNGVALVELNGQIYVIPPKSLVTIAPGVPHTWTACPAGVSVPAPQGTTTEEVLSDGTFLMLYEYEEPTAFFPTRQTETLTRVDGYERCDDLEAIRIPRLSADEVRQRCWFVWDRTFDTASIADIYKQYAPLDRKRPSLPPAGFFAWKQRLLGFRRMVPTGFGTGDSGPFSITEVAPQG